MRIDVDWLRGTKPVTARIYGDGVGIWDRSSQFTLARDQVVAALKVFRDARFGAMPASFGRDMEGEDESPVRLKGQVVLRIGPQVKRVAQMEDGDQSTGLAGIAEKLLAICAGPAARGKGAGSLAEGIRLLEEKKLSPQVLSVAVQRGEGSGERWILRVDGRTVTDRAIRPGGSVSVPRRLTLSEADFLAFVKSLNEAQVEALPSNLYAHVYTDLRVSLLGHSRSLTAREFHNMKPETHGAKQQSFDRIFAALETLHERAEKNGSPSRKSPSYRRPTGKARRKKSASGRKSRGTRERARAELSTDAVSQSA